MSRSSITNNRDTIPRLGELNFIGSPVHTLTISNGPTIWPVENSSFSQQSCLVEYHFQGLWFSPWWFSAVLIWCGTYFSSIIESEQNVSSMCHLHVKNFTSMYQIYGDFIMQGLQRVMLNVRIIRDSAESFLDSARIKSLCEKCDWSSCRKKSALSRAERKIISYQKYSLFM